MEAVAIPQSECFDAAMAFTRSEGILPAPEPTHALAAAIREAKKWAAPRRRARVSGPRDALGGVCCPPACMASRAAHSSLARAAASRP